VTSRQNERVEQASIARFFDAMAPQRNDLFRSNPILDYEQTVRSRAVLSMLKPQPEETIIDIGCGNARDILPILRAHARVVGVDISVEMIRQGKDDLARAGFPDVELQVGDATHLNFPPCVFDGVLCSEVIEHIPDAAAAIGEIYRVLRPGGRLVLSTPNRASWYGFDRYVVWTRILRRKWNHPFDRWRTMRELTTLLDDQGFAVGVTRTVCYVPGFLLTYFVPALVQRLITAPVRLWETVASHVAPRWGYLLVLTATKRA
jgi:ubiquinone/menaquinone biosynthesis C-methylase UbiE